MKTALRALLAIALALATPGCAGIGNLCARKPRPYAGAALDAYLLQAQARGVVTGRPCPPALGRGGAACLTVVHLIDIGPTVAVDTIALPFTIASACSQSQAIRSGTPAPE